MHRLRFFRLWTGDLTEIFEEFIEARPHRWRVLRCGSGPLALCLHGAGGSADSFKPLMNELAERLTLVAPDLPGHGKTRLGSQGRSGLKEMADDICLLMNALKCSVDLSIGHSAGAAIALAAESRLSPRGHVLINAALSEFGGLAGWLFPTMAKGLSAAPFAADLLSNYLSKHDRLRGLLKATGSKITDEIYERYAHLAGDPEHIKGTLRMMASWQLQPVLRGLPTIETPILLIAGEEDGTVPISVSKQAEKTLRNARLIIHKGGHLLHEEGPTLVAHDILEFISRLADTDPHSG